MTDEREDHVTDPDEPALPEPPEGWVFVEPDVLLPLVDDDDGEPS